MTKVDLFRRAFALEYRRIRDTHPSDFDEESIPLISEVTLTEKQLKSKAYLRKITMNPTRSDFQNLADLVDDGESITLENGTTMTKQELLLTVIALNPKGISPYFQLAYSLEDGESITLENGTIITKRELLQTGHALKRQLYQKNFLQHPTPT